MALTPLSFDGTNYTQNFNTLPGTGAAPIFTGAGPFDVPTSDSSVGLAGWSFLKSGGSGSNATFRIDTGSGTSGGVVSYGNASDSDRALGSVASGTTASTFGVTLVNNTAAALTSFTLSYAGEQWRRGSGIANTLTFSFALGATDLAVGSYTNFSGLSLTAPVTTGTSIALNGNDAANRIAISQSVSGLTWAPGTTLTLRWVDVDNTGSDDGLAIDDLTFSAITAQLRTLIWNTAGGTWDGITANWTGDATTFQTGDNVRFTDAQVGSVVIDAGGVNPVQIQVENTVGTYTFSGGAITSPGTLSKTGAGTLALSSTVNLTQGLQIDAGVVRTTADELINDANPVKISGGTLDIQGFTETVDTLVLTGGFVNGSGGTLAVNSGVTVGPSTTTSVISSGLKTGAAALNVAVADGDAAVDFRVSGPLSGTSRLVFNGAGTSEVLGDNAGFGGGVSLNAGRLVVDQSSSLGSNSFFLNGGTFAATAPITLTNAVSVGGNVTIDGTNAIELSSFSSSFGSAAKVISVLGNVTISGAISGTSVLNKGGSGTLILTGANSFTTNTTIQGGTLKLTGNGTLAGTPSVRVDAGATLDLSTLPGTFVFTGNGTVMQTLRGGGTVVAPVGGLRMEGALSPGGTAAGFFTQTLTVQGGPLSLGSTATLAIEIGGVGSGNFDALVLQGQNLTLDGNLQISLLNGYAPQPADAFTIITADGGFTGQFANMVDGRVNFTEGSFAVTQAGTTLTLNDFAAVPEPSALALLCGGMLLVAWLVRKKSVGRKTA